MTIRVKLSKAVHVMHILGDWIRRFFEQFARTAREAGMTIQKFCSRHSWKRSRWSVALIKPCCFWEYRRVAPDLLDREDELSHRLFVRLSKPEKGANQLLVKTLMRSFETADIEQDMIPPVAPPEKFPDAISLPVPHGRDSSL